MKPRSVPTMTDEEAEAFLDQDLSDLDFTALKPLTWWAEPKTARRHPPAPHRRRQGPRRRARHPLTCA